MTSKTYDINFFFNHFSNIESNKIGFSFSFFLHFIILLLAIGLPNFFEPAPIKLPNIIPIEIINVADITSVPEKVESKTDKVIKEETKNKQFNNIENEQSVIEPVKIKPKEVIEEVAETIIPKENENVEKKINPDIELKVEKKIILDEKVESLPDKKIKPKIKPVQKVLENEIDEKPEKKITPKLKPKQNNFDKVKEENKDIMLIAKPKPKPEPKFNIASMLKDLRNEKSSIVDENKDENKKENQEISEDTNSSEEMAQLSISEIDLLIQQLSACWAAPAGAVIEKGMVVKIGAKIKPNRRILENSVRIIDTNISKSNSFYGPITESAMRTLLNPDCIPLKLPVDKYELWKNITITFDHSIMKGY